MEKILIVEDDLDINNLLHRILQKEGYEVVSAYSGTEGALRLSMENFDLMLCDLMLPGMSGEELIQPELLARIEAQLRRVRFMKDLPDKKKEEIQDLTFRDLVLQLDALSATVQNVKLELTTHEFAILKVMLESPKKVFSKESLYESVWKNGYYGEDNTISVHISNIRKKIAKITSEEYISTVWGIGYKLNF